MKTFWVIFISVFLAELGDKTQLATMSFASSAQKGTFPWLVFWASASALVLSSLVGTLFGASLTRFINPLYLKIVSGILFLIIGIFLLFDVRNEWKEKKQLGSFHPPCGKKECSAEKLKNI